MRAYLELIRLPNLPSALGNICLGAISAGLNRESIPSFLLTLMASALLYSSGMAWNDYFDASLDKRERPERPIPSGRVSKSAAMRFACLLMVAAFVLILVVEWLHHYSGLSAGITLALIVMIFAYDAAGKNLPIGPMLMGSCRALNVLLGWAAVSPLITETAWMQAIVVGVYVCGITLFAREEHTISSRTSLIFAAAIIAGSMVIAMIVPSSINGPIQAPWFYPYLVTGLGIIIFKPLLEAIRKPTPDMVQKAVVSCLRKMIWLDAILASGVAGNTGFWILLLLMPGMYLARLRKLKAT
jgi:4-hydroxybenzoate polyprenyltransferase